MQDTTNIINAIENMADMQDQTTKTNTKTATKTQDIGTRAPIQYDIQGLNDFIHFVFHSDFGEDEFALGWSSKTNTPSFPKDLDKLPTKLANTRNPKACYYATSTVTPHQDDNKLYNRKSQFKRLHVIVLDDIGTKVKQDDLPEDLVPNYIIESSEGNYQYGFVLETPIDNYELAEALVHLVYTSGYSDEGGKLVSKVVRLPCGINGKKGDKGDFNVRLVGELNRQYWTPEELLDVLDVGVTWADVTKDINSAKAGNSSRFAGTSLWSPIKPTAASLNGVIDPVLEYLYEQNRVVNDNGEWVTIECPWHEEHTTGDSFAGYSPIGRGSEGMSNRRGFHCFHGHCAERTTNDFLQQIAIESGIYAPVIDHVADLVADYAFVAGENSAYRLRGVNKPIGLKMEAFKNAYPKKVRVFDHDGKQKMIAESALWLTSPSRLTLQGLMSDPSSAERVIEHDNLKYLNTYAHPQWGTGAFKQADVDYFKDFLDYLIPDDTERDYFTQWLAAKVQDPTFKGAAVLMVAPTQGTGRTTLSQMMDLLFTQNNTSKVTFSQLCDGTRAGAFNEFLESILVMCDEVMTDPQIKYTQYESLKDLFDPKAKRVEINRKYGGKAAVMNYSSYLLFTNHEEAIGALGDDRRVYVISNTMTPNTPRYFTELNEWINKGEWMQNVWRWLMTLTPDLEMLNAPAPLTKAKSNMITQTKGVADIIAETVLERLHNIDHSSTRKELVHSVLDTVGASNIDTKIHAVNTIIRRATTSTGSYMRINGKRADVRVCKKWLVSQGIRNTNGELPDNVLALIDEQKEATKSLIENDFDKLVIEIADIVDASGV